MESEEDEKKEEGGGDDKKEDDKKEEGGDDKGIPFYFDQQGDEKKEGDDKEGDKGDEKGDKDGDKGDKGDKDGDKGDKGDKKDEKSEDKEEETKTGPINKMEKRKMLEKVEQIKNKQKGYERKEKMQKKLEESKAQAQSSTKKSSSTEIELVNKIKKLEAKLADKEKKEAAVHSAQGNIPEFRDFIVESGLSRGEERQIYATVDKHKKNDISKDWNEFYGLFVIPFKQCDTDHTHYIDQSEFERCFHREEWKVFKDASDGDEMEIALDIVDIVSRGRKKINFADYMVIRRSQVAWERCSDKQGLSKLRFLCAVQVALPYENTYDPMEIENLFETAVHLNRGRLYNFLFLDIPSFIDFVHLFTYFYDFDMPINDGLLTKEEFMRGVQMQILPVTLNYRNVESMYRIIDDQPMTASAFVCIWDTFEMLLANDLDGNGMINSEEFLYLLSHKNIDKILLNHIDGLYLPSEGEILEESKKSTKNAITEKSFILNFMQTSSKYRKHHSKKFLRHSKSSSNKNDFLKITNEAKYRRKLVYFIFDEFEKEKMALGDLLLFRKLSWNFVGYAYIIKLIDGPKLKEESEKFDPPILYTEHEKAKLNDLILFLSNYLIINIKDFYNFFAAERMFDKYRIPGSLSNVSEDAIKNVFSKQSIVFSESTISDAKEFFRAGRERVQYNFDVATKSALFYESNVLRSKRLFELKIKQNTKLLILIFIKEN